MRKAYRTSTLLHRTDSNKLMSSHLKVISSDPFLQRVTENGKASGEISLFY